MAIAILFGVFAVLLLLGVPVAFALAASALATLLYLGPAVDRGGAADLRRVRHRVADRDPAVHLRRRDDDARRHLRPADRARLLAGRAPARRPGAGQRAVLAVLRRRVGFGDRRRVGDRRHDDPADGQARLRPRLRGQRAHDRGAGRAAGAAVAQPDPVLGVGRRRHLDRRPVRGRHHAGAADDRGADDHRLRDGPPPRLRDRAVPGLAGGLLRFVGALPGLLLVALIFIGIRAGIFTAVEIAAIAVVYALLVTSLLYRAAALARVPRGLLARRAHHRRDPVRDRHRGVVRLAAGLPAGAGRRGARSCSRSPTTRTCCCC